MSRSPSTRKTRRVEGVKDVVADLQKNLSRGPAGLGFPGVGAGSLALLLPLSGRVTPRAFIGIALSARGTKDGLMSSIGSRVIGHASPCATRLANDGSICLNEHREDISGSLHAPSTTRTSDRT